MDTSRACTLICDSQVSPQDLIIFFRRQLPVILCFLTISYTTGKGQSSLRFEHVSLEHSLSNDAVYAINQDQHGFIWIGTEDGLNRFDGYEMVFFRHDPSDSGSISSNWVSSIFEDRQGRLWIGNIGKGLNLLEPTSGRIQRFLEYTFDSLNISLDIIYSIFEDDQGYLWLGGDQLHQFDPATGKFIWHPLEAGILQIFFFQEAPQGRLWVGTTRGLYQYDRTTGRLQPFSPVPLLKRANPEEGFRGFLLDSQDRLWIMGPKSLLHLAPNTGQLDTVVENLITQSDYLIRRNIVEDHAGDIWIGETSRGLIRLKPETALMDSYQHDPGNPVSISKDLGNTLFVDRQGSLWIGGVNGLDRLAADHLKRQQGTRGPSSFQHLQVVPGKTTDANQKMVRVILKDSRADFWIGTYNGLYRYRQEGQELMLTDHFTHDPGRPFSISSNEVRALLEDRRGDIWVATRKGLNRIDGGSGQVEPIRFGEVGPDDLSEEIFWNLYEDDQGMIWIGTQNTGLLSLDPKTRRVRRFNYDQDNPTSLSRNEVLKVYQDRQGRIWAGTYGGGLNLFIPRDSSFQRYMPDPRDTTSLSGDQVWTIFEDQQDRIWIGTQNGLNLLVPEKGNGTTTYRFKHYLERDGLVNNTVYGILQDKLGRLWLSTLKGLSCFDPEGGTFLNFDLEDGLQDYSFIPNACFKDPGSGEMFFGGVNGYNRFFPENFQADTFAPPVVISSLTRINKNENGGNPIVDYFVAGQTNFRFSYLDDIIIFNLALLNFNKPEKNRYEYRLEGLQTNWAPLGTDRKITLIGLNSGKYILRLRGANHHNIRTTQETRIVLTLTPPWWWSNPAKILYLLLGVGAITGIYRYQLQKRLVEQEARQLKELDEVKSRFFTNISHEFRTPLTVISGMASQVKLNPGQWLDEGMELIQRNSSQLLSLINQILDLRKLESGALKVNCIRGDIIPYIHYIADPFVTTAQSKGLQIHVLSDPPALEMDYDPEKTLVILSNLLSNAVKYTPAPGDIYLKIDHGFEASGEQLVIQVKDTGMGIPPGALPYVFDRFYQADPDFYRQGPQKPQGTGVGLALTRELVLLLGGSIHVDSNPEGGSIFTVSLPVSRIAPVQQRIIHPATGGNSADLAAARSMITPSAGDHFNRIPAGRKDQPPPADDLPTLLIVEDNPDVRVYLKACLAPHYELLTAENGQEGIDRAIEKVPDLIVSDVMMPVKDGFALCETLKNDVRTSHIPIILLTARADFESRIKGLRRGADVYLAKPFEQEELLVHLEQLLVLRKKLQARYRSYSFAGNAASLPENPLPEAVANEVDDGFMKNARELILDHLSEEDFGVMDLCRGIGVSRSQLHKKVKALTGLSTTAFIRSIRLHKARALLQTTNLNVSEVGYEVGISNPAYFSRIYTEEFGEAPSRTRK